MIVNLDTDRVIAYRPHTALSFSERLFGLMGKRFESLPYDALIFCRCRALHTCFMSMPIDVVFLDAQGKILSMRHHVKAWKSLLGPRNTFWSIELPANTLKSTHCAHGHRLNLNMEMTEETQMRFARDLQVQIGLAQTLK